MITNELFQICIDYLKEFLESDKNPTTYTLNGHD